LKGHTLSAFHYTPTLTLKTTWKAVRIHKKKEWSNIEVPLELEDNDARKSEETFCEDA